MILDTPCIPPTVYERNMSIEHWWNEDDGRNRSNQRKTCPSATSSTKNPIQNGLRSKLGFYKRQAPRFYGIKEGKTLILNK
jgi:hypothetical protein